jgi:LysR family nitrogen assimilation transcriptional regulator
MDIRELRYFTQVARSGSFVRAASVLNVTQSAISRQLQKLEGELGVTLLVRRQHGVEVTEAGSILLEHAEMVINYLAQIRDLVRGNEETFAGHAVLGVPPTSGILITPQVLGSFKTRWPYATLQVREGISSSLEEWLLDRRVDVAVLHNPLQLDGIDLLPVLQENMVLVFRPGATVVPMNKASIRFRDLTEVPLVLPSLPHANRRLLERVALQHGLQLNVATEVDGVYLVKELVKRGFGATVVTYAGIAAEVERGELNAIPIERPQLVSTISIGSRHDAKTRWLTKELISLVRAAVVAVAASGQWPGARVVGPDAYSHEAAQIGSLVRADSLSS